MGRVKAALLATTALGGIAAMSVATQFAAWRMGYHPALGDPFAIIHGLPFYKPWAWLEWASAPWAPRAAQTFTLIKTGLMLGLISVAVPTVLIKNARHRRPRMYPDIHGTARFATAQEIEASGLLEDAPSALHVGGCRAEDGIRPLRDAGPAHVAVVAPTRGGKGVGVVVPSLLAWLKSSVIYDEKAELFALTAGARASSGNEILRWQPGLATGGARYNFLDAVRIGTPREVADAQSIALLLIDRDGKGIDAGKEAHWNRTAASLLSGLILFVCHEYAHPSLANVARELSMRGEDGSLFEEMRAHWNDFVAQAGATILGKKGNERPSVLSTASAALELFRDPLIAANTSGSDFAITDLVNAARPVSLFVITPGDDKLRLRPLVRLLLATVMRTLTGAELRFDNGQPVPPHRWRMALVIDEFPSLGKIDVIEDGLPKCAGYGIRVLLVIQDRDQLRGAYGQHESILANCHTRIALAPNSVETAKWLSEMTGEATIVREEVSESGKRMGALSHVNRRISENKRPLMTADEIMRMQPLDPRTGIPGEMLIFHGSMHPIKGTQTPYFLDDKMLAKTQVELPDER